MISFSDAQMEGANDKKFQAQHNYLIELMSTYLTRGTLESLNKENFINLKDGTFKLGTTDDSEYVRQIGNGLEIKGKITITGGNAVIADDLGDLAYKNEVKEAMEDELIIVGGYLDASFIKIRTSSTTSRLELTGDGLRGYLSNDLRVEVKNDRLQFSKSGSVIGNVRTAPVTGFGECLFIEAAGKYIAFNADSTATNPSMLVSPTWVDIPVLSTEEISIGETSPPQWRIDTNSTDSILSFTHTGGGKINLNSSGDITARLLKATYIDQTTIRGAIAYRINNSTDNYTRYCSNKSAIMSWLGALPLAGGTMSGQLNMGNANIVGGTGSSGTEITCERIGCGIAANSSYTVDANTNYMRAGRYYARTGFYAWNTSDSAYNAGWSGVYGGAMYIGGLLIDPDP